MADCELWEGEEQISLYYVGEENLNTMQEANCCLNAFKELELIIQPLSVEVGIGYRHRQALSFKYDLRDRPEIPYWHWEISSIPPQIITEGFYPDGAKVIPVENITTENLSKWIIEPLQQKSPDPEYEVAWSQMNICAVKARVIDEIRFIGRDYYLVKTPIDEYKYPLIKHDDGLWVYSPQKPYGTYPTMTIRILNSIGIQQIKFSIPWTVWYDEYSPEYYYFYQAVQRIIAQGWQLSEYTPMKEPKYAA